MGFAGVYRAVFAYSATNEQELSLQEGDILYLLETADDGWWTVKKRVAGAASEEPEGIVPHNYIEPAKPESKAFALYNYDTQNDEELSFTENQQFDVYASDGDWILVGSNSKYGFVPVNYIQVTEALPASESVPLAIPQAAAPPASAPQAAPQASVPQAAPQETSRAPQAYSQPATSAPPAEEEEAAPPKPQRPNRTGQSLRPARTGDSFDSRSEDNFNRDKALPAEPRRRSSSGAAGPGESSWPVMDVVGRRKIAKTLVVAQQHVTLINDDGGGKTQKWDVPDIVRYSSEKKYVFLDLVNPKASLQLRVNTSEEANHIVASLGQIVGAGRAGGGLQEVLNAAESKGLNHGEILLDFMAANSKELTVNEGDQVMIVNSTGKEWWLVRNLNGKEGYVPMKFVHIEREENKLTGLFKGKKQRERQMEKDQSSARDAAKSLERSRSRANRASASASSSHGSRPDFKRSGSSLSRTGSHANKSLPDSRKMRLWVDRTGTFKVDAQLLGCSDGKVHLHKANGVKIAVPASKLSASDVDYVESVTGVNLGDDKPLKRNASRRGSRPSGRSSSPAAASGDSKHDYWLSFFLECGVDPQNANRYAKNFSRDNMDESTLQDTNTSVLRTLGLREGDILRVSRRINEKLGKVQKPEGGLYSNEGALQNNSGAAPKSVGNEVWANQAPALQPQAAQPALQSQPTQPALQPQATTQAAVIQPQLTQPALQPQAAQQPQPTGALADLLGVTSISQPSLTSQPTQPAQASQNSTAEAELASKQRQTQQQILQMQAQLQKEQIRLLKEQQDQLRKQQNELVTIQRTGTQMQALGPFATGNAMKSSFSAPAPAPAASVLAAPAPPQPRPFQPTTTGGFPTQTTGGFPTQTTGGFPTQTTGGFPTQTTGGFPTQTTGGFPTQTTGGLQAHTTGPFQSQTTGPFQQAQATGPFQQSQATGPFQQTTGFQPTGSLPPTSFQSQPPTSFQPQTTGPFQSQTTTSFQSQTTGSFPQPPTSFQPQTTGPFQQNTGLPPTSFQTTGNQLSANTTGPFQSLQQHTTGPFQTGLQNTGLQNTGFQGLQQHTTGPFQNTGLQQHTTGPFQNAGLQQHTTGPFQSTGFPTGMQSQATGPFQAQNTAASQPFNSFQSMQSTQTNTAPTTSFGSAPLGQQPTFGQQPTTFGQQPTSFGQQPTSFGQQPTSFGQQPTSFGQQPTSFGQQPFGQQPVGQQPATPGGTSFGQQPLQSQATGFGFGNQPSQSRANLSMASASNPFGL